MKKSITITALLLSAFFATATLAQDTTRKVVDFTGGARSIITNNGLSVSDSIPDTTTVGHTTTGYALVDLGVNIRPNQHTELLGMFRIRSEYGGFWGAGVTFDVRQLWLKGVIGDIVRYQVGDLNLKQTPFTLFNHHADRFDSLPEIFSLQSAIVDYERFYTGNTWRQQGVNVDFGLTFAKGIQGIDFTGYLTRMNATDFLTVPDRLLGGFSAVVVQQEDLKVGFHQSSMFDVQGTAAEDVSFSNQVQSVTGYLHREVRDLSVVFDGEAGQSRYSDSRFADRPALEDYFLYGKFKSSWKSKQLSFTVGYMNVGPDFRSLGAQSKDIDYSSLPENFNRYTNNQIVRPLDLADLIGGNNQYTTSVSDKLMDIDPSVNNILPYGLATFNRLGAFAGADYKGIKGLRLEVMHYSLREIRGQGTLALKEFSKTDFMARCYLDEALAWKKRFGLHAGISLQNTDRKGNISVEDVSLKSTRLQGGMEIELTKGLDLLGGVVMLTTTGNDFTAVRNDYTEIDYFEGVEYDLAQQTLSGGIRYRFQNNIYLCGLYQSSRYDDRTKALPGYTVNQFAIIYNMTF